MSSGDFTATEEHTIDAFLERWPIEDLENK